MLTIQNVSRRTQVFNLNAGAFQEMQGPHGYKLVHVKVVDVGRNGFLSARKIPRMVCSSLTFLAGEKKSGLPNELLAVGTIAQALKPGGALRLISQTTDDPSPAAPAEQPKPPADEQPKPTDEQQQPEGKAAAKKRAPKE